MAIIKETDKDSKVFYQEWGEDSPGEPAIIITAFNDSIQLDQGNDAISISRHELKPFIKHLQSLLKQDK